MAAAYFVYLAVLACFARVPAKQRARAIGIAFAVAGVIVVFGMPHVMPLVYLLTGYWLPALLVGAPDTRLERALLAFDRRLFGTDGLTIFRERAPRWLVEYLELSYLLCYAVVPGGYLWLRLAGFQDEADRFWSTVLLASFFCYGLLPWLPTRAPRALVGLDSSRAPRAEVGLDFSRAVLEGEGGLGRSAVRRLNLAVLSRASVQWNTFPSGHTAASLATALAVGAHVPVAGVVLGFIGVSIAAGSVVGRYHYAADAIAGAVVAWLAFATAIALHAP